MISELLAYYDENKRDLPWRQSLDPYRIWISEIMCQQTRVDTVIPYFERFVESFPNVAALAAADPDLLNKHWQGLGYYSRARNLQKAAKVMVDRFGGNFPTRYEDVLSLPGIGEYSAAAICAMAFDQPYAAVDGNFLRVFSRLYEDPADIALESTKQALREKLIPQLPSRSGDWNQAVMDLGATICIPGDEPHCDRCPLAAECLAHAHNTESEFPVTSKKQKVTELHYTLFLVTRPSTATSNFTNTVSHKIDGVADVIFDTNSKVAAPDQSTVSGADSNIAAPSTAGAPDQSTISSADSNIAAPSTAGASFVIALRRRPDTGLLAGLYEFPNAEGRLSKKQVQALFPGAAIAAGVSKDHHFTHRTWHMHPFLITLPPAASLPDALAAGSSASVSADSSAAAFASAQNACFWATTDQLLHTYSVPRAFNQFFDQLGL